MKRGNTVGSRPGLSSNEAAYLAGFLDGDGCISAKVGRYPNSWSGFRVRVIISYAQKTQNRELLERIRLAIGFGRKVADYRSNRMSELIISARKEVKQLLEAIVPFLKLKKPRARLALSIVSLLDRKRELKNAVSRENFMEVLKLAQRMRQLNSGAGLKENDRLRKIIDTGLTP